MNFESVRIFCLEKRGTTEEFPFDETTLVFKVMGKMFALSPLDRDPPCINLKCDPEKSIELREEYNGINPGYHMSKKHWNTILLEDDVDSQLLANLINHSYDLVVAKLPKKLRTELENTN